MDFSQKKRIIEILPPPSFPSSLLRMSVISIPDIRPARLEDAGAIARIYNDSVLHSTATFQIAPDAVETRRAWLKARQPRYPVFVAVQEGAVIAWTALSAYSQREAWLHTVEDSIYLDASVRRCGLGTILLTKLLEVAQQLGHRVVLARIAGDQTASLALHTKLGFVEKGRLTGVGLKFGRWLDVAYLQKDL
jgi:phosphinothricin acetyltransferase